MESTFNDFHQHCTKISETCEVKLEPEESSVCAMSEDLITQSALSVNCLLGGCEIESGVKCELEECADINYNQCGETLPYLAALDSSERLVENNSHTESIKQERFS